jgi:hypothetical protein
MGHIRGIGGTGLLGALLLAAPLAGAVSVGAAETDSAYQVDLANVSGKVGDTTVLHATLRPKNGYRVLEDYNNRIIMLSSFDDGVEFAKKSVPAVLHDGTLEFAVELKPTKAGPHPINGVFRVGYVDDPNSTFEMINVPLIATVTGTE